jgi:peroxiredoxin
MTAKEQPDGLQRGDLIPSFSLASGNRPGRLGPWDYKQRTNLLVFLSHGDECEACRNFSRGLASEYGELRSLETELLAVSPDGVEQLRRIADERSVPFPLLSDESGAVRAAYLGRAAGRGEVGVFVADRFGALFVSWRGGDAGDLPGLSELRDWLVFLEIQCEECHPPEW